MPLARVRERWFAEAADVHRTLRLEDHTQTQERTVRKIARAFGVTPTAMRVRLKELKLLGI